MAKLFNVSTHLFQFSTAIFQAQRVYGYRGIPRFLASLSGFLFVAHIAAFSFPPSGFFFLGHCITPVNTQNDSFLFY
ncbi:MAG: hypothetical protein LUC90_07050 [Lachnospiraceae bacterium]|nr:hypothetical protein [Lachnospiraceae bacterium]